MRCYLRVQRRRRRWSRATAASGWSRGGRASAAAGGGTCRPALFLLALALLLVALARPQTVVSLPRLEGTVILAFDVSGSMAADDLKPTRMEAAKVAARDFVRRQPPTVQIGVVSFSDGGLSIQAPTNDQDAVLAAINRLAPARGTSLANGILASLNTIATARTATGPRYYTNRTPEPTATPTPCRPGTHTSAVIVLLTDGENNEPPDPLEAAKAAADRGVRIYTVGIGSPAGATLKIEGFSVRRSSTRRRCKQIAQMTDGTYYNAGDERGPCSDLRESRLAVRGQAGADRGDRALRGRGHARDADRRHLLAPVVRSGAV